MRRTNSWCLTLLSLTVASLCLKDPAWADLPTPIRDSQNLIGASGNPNDSDRPPTDHQADPTTSPLLDVLMGHWVTDNGTTHYYFGQNQVIVVNLLQRQDRSIASHKQKLSYEVLSANADTSIVQLQITTPLGWAETRRLRFASNHQTLLETTEVMGHSFSSEWSYVNDRQQP